MKKILISIFLIFSLVGLVSCNLDKPTDTPGTPDPDVPVLPDDKPELDKDISIENNKASNNDNLKVVYKDRLYITPDEVALYIVSFQKLPNNYHDKTNFTKLVDRWSYNNLYSLGYEKYENDLFEHNDYYYCDIKYTKDRTTTEKLLYSVDELTVYYTADEKVFYKLYENGQTIDEDLPYENVITKENNMAKNNISNVVVYENQVYNSKEEVSLYLAAFNKLPANFYLKNDFKKDKWTIENKISCGGDNFGNREGLLPVKDSYYECDINYQGGPRGSERIVFSKLSNSIFYTADHYNSFKGLYLYGIYFE